MPRLSLLLLVIGIAVALELSVCHHYAASTPRETVQQCKRLVSIIPQPNMELLKRLMQLLSEVAEFQTINNMNSKNLAIVFAPNLFRGRDVSTLQSLKDTPFIMGITKALIDYRDEIFPVCICHTSHCTAQQVVTPLLTETHIPSCTTID
jgi:hypothetical protein